MHWTTGFGSLWILEIWIFDTLPVLCKSKLAQHIIFIISEWHWEFCFPYTYDLSPLIHFSHISFMYIRDILLKYLVFLFSMSSLKYVPLHKICKLCAEIFFFQCQTKKSYIFSLTGRNIEKRGQYKKKS